MSETLSLVPGSLIQFHRIPLDLSRFRKVLATFSFWVRPDQEESTAEQKITKLIPLSRIDENGQECWEWYEPVPGQSGRDERKVLPCRGGIPPEEIISVSYKNIRETCTDQWIPMPWLAHWENENGSEFHNYPSNWVRGCLRVDENGENCHIELAFDTTIDLNETSQTSRGGDGRMMPTLADVRDDIAFGMPADPNVLRNWLTENFWLREWMTDLTQATHDRVSSRRQQQPISVQESEKKSFEPDALWLALARALSEIVDLPRVRFIKLDRAPPIEVDLVLDLGNFRSCGVLIEQMPDRAVSSSNGLEHCSLLELRDLARPSNSYKGIFPSRTEFGKASFGLDNRSRGSGRSAAFYWPGQVRVGQQAERMLTSKRGSEGRSGLATPKRYLWSREPWMNGWYFNTSDDYPNPGNEQPATGRFRKPLRELLTSTTKWGGEWSVNALPTLLSYDGDDFEEKAAKSAGPCILSRSQLFVLMVEELVLHAIRFMNDPIQRAKRGLEGTARHLRSVVFTMPPGMALAERRIFLERVKAGVCFAWHQAEQNTLWQVAGWKDAQMGENKKSSLHTPPSVECDLDEATATQLVWLENEIVTRMGGNVKEFFALYGRNRTLPDGSTGKKVTRETVRIASLDIGGGTTDMMVATYARENSDALTPTQNFRESFQLAGDNLLEKVTTDIVLKQAVAPALQDAGMPAPLSLLLSLFKGNSEDVRDEAVRHLLVSILLEPAGLKVLELYENVPAYKTGVIGSFTLRESENLPDSRAKNTQWERCADFLRKFMCAHYKKHDVRPTPEMAAFLYPEQQDTHEDDGDDATRIKPFDPRAIVVTVNAEDVEKCIHSTLGQTLKQFSAAIRAYGCDVMLLSGRPSKLRHVTDIITSQLPVMPQRIIRMHDYTVSRFYPFSDVHNKISDPKTTVVSGAAIWKLAGQKRLLNFTLRTEELKMKSTVNYIGVMQAGAGTVAEALNDKPLDLETPAADKNSDEGKNVIEIPNFANEIHLGWRQLPNPSWMATPLYRIRFRDNGHEELRSKGYTDSCTLYLKQAVPSLTHEDLSEYDPVRMLEEQKKAALQQEDLVLCELTGMVDGKKQELGINTLKNVLEIQLMTTLDPKGHWRDTGCLALD
ncbi:virulence factor SrfB [Acetobacter persici]|uniref:virulence factor SrfB n=1 Tax=Acetobacter persici TaxID=1076596 RepID=UPI001BAC84D5|nr:virulence factor SrfB [Acetobacter persici]